MTKLLALDTETHLIAPGLAAPPMVCTTWANDQRSDIVHVNDAKAYWQEWLAFAGRKHLLTGVNFAAYDMAVVLAQWPDLAPLVFEAFEAGGITDSMIDQRLIDIKNGVLESKLRPKSMRYYSMKALMLRHFDEDIAKGEDTWRLRYRELENLPCSHWDAEAARVAEFEGRPFSSPTQYAIDDAVNSLRIAKHQRSGDDADALAVSGHFAYSAFALYLQACRGLRTDPVACQKLLDGLETELARCERLLLKKGLLKPNAKGGLSKVQKAARDRLVATLPPGIRTELDEAIAEAKAYAAAGAKKARAMVCLEHSLSDKELARAQKKLDKLQRKDLSLKKLRKAWRKAGYDEELRVALMSLVKKPRVFKALGVSITKTGLVSVNATACKQSGDKVLEALSMHTSANTLRKKVQRMIKGAYIPLQTTYTIPVSSGRTSSRASEAPLVGDNFQNFRRSAMHLQETNEDLPGMRECFVPRPGYVYCSIDGDAAEMRGYAQLEYDRLGVSELRDVLNAGKSPHRVVGSDIMQISEKKFEKRYKEGDPEAINAAQFAKIPNFALLGGGGYKILPDYAQGMGIKLDLPQSKDLYDIFHSRWKHVKEMHKHYREYIHKVWTNPRTGMKFYLDRYAQACNRGFQNIVAFAMERACCHLARESYTPDGQLWGSYPVLFLHDEVLFELREDVASEHAWRAARIMIDAFNYYTPDVPLTATPALMRRFSKGAKTILHETKKDSDGNPLLLVHGD